MNMRTIIITKGLPASGKSTYAKGLLKQEPKRWKRVNKDDIRAMLDDSVWSKENEKVVEAVQDQAIRVALNAGYDVIVDNTHLVAGSLKKLHLLASDVGDVTVIEKSFNVALDECLFRNSKRPPQTYVPEKAIREMARMAGINNGVMLEDSTVTYPARVATKSIKFDESLPKAIMCDLDGTLALINNRSPYDATDCDIKDLPNWPVIHTVLAMHAQGFKVIFMSGRDEKYRPETERFIERYCIQRNKENLFENGNQTSVFEPIHYELYMRGQTAPNPDKLDQRKDSVVKKELFDRYVRGKYNVLFVLDDRNQVVDFWRSIGLTCFQVNPGAF